MSNDNEILKYLEQAEQGDYYAMLKVADSYFHRHDDEKSLETALHWYIRAAESNHPIIKADAMAQAGLMFYNGIGTPVDYDAAFKWLKDCVLFQRNPPAVYALAELYFHGRGVNRNYSKAAELYSMAWIYGRNGNAAYRLAEIHEYGYNGEIDNKRALDYYIAAANHGHEVAMCKLGLIYETGEIIEQDYQEAIQWYRLAADCGNKFAATKLEELQDVDLSYPYQITWS